MEDGTLDYTRDGSVDLKGNAIRRSNTGGWKAFSFLIVYGVFERMAYFGVLSNLMVYIMKKLNQDTVTSSNMVTKWIGTICMAPILGAYVADAHLGRYWTTVIASIIYFLGMGLLTLSVSIPSLKPPKCYEMDVTKCKKASTLQLVVFYGALYILALGIGGTKPNLSTIGASQFDEFDPKEKRQKQSFFNWWMCCVIIGAIFSLTGLVYIQDNVSWTLGYALPTLGLAIATAIFLAGTPFYRHKLLTGSPITSMAKVFVATMRKWRVVVPKDPNELYELGSEEYTRKGKFKLHPTPTLRFLNKACVDNGSSRSEWMLCPVTQVEETKQMLRLIPILVATFVPSAMVTMTSTLFVKQATTLDQGIGKFNIPPASLAALATLSMLFTYILYECFIVKMMRRLTKNSRGITLLQKMGTGIAIHIVIAIVVFFTERHRLSVAKQHGVVESGGQVPLSILILAPQYVLMGMADALVEVAKIEFFYDQVPESMKSIGTSYSTTSTGIGNFISTFILTTVSHITEKHGHQGWILNNLNASHLDYYYALLIILNIMNFLFFMLVAKYYVYKVEVSNSLEVFDAELRTTAHQGNSED